MAPSLAIEDCLNRSIGDLIKVLQDRTINRTKYFGVPTQKVPLDLWVYQEIITDIRPEVIIEIGTRFGGSALYMAHILDQLGHGRVVTVDINPGPIHEAVRKHPRITIVTGDATKPEVLAGVVKQACDSTGAPPVPCIVIEDSAHSCWNTLAVLKAYWQLVTVGSYFIVEDSIIAHGINWSVDGWKTPADKTGPWAAIDAFLAENKAFVSDRWREDFLVTWNPKGYLRRIG